MNDAPPEDVLPKRTWDGMPIAPDDPHGAQIVVRRPAGAGGAEFEYLMLHRATRGPGYEGDWAWTPPSGARLPGEPILAGAERELAEETGLRGIRLRPADMSGPWAVFAAEVPPDARVTLPDAEHDRFAWLRGDEAAHRCLPAPVAITFRLAATLPAPSVTFRPLAAGDLPDLVGWMHAPHAARWFYEDLDLAAAERKYRPRIDGSSPVRVHVILIGGRACGFIQHYPVRGPGYSPAAGEPDAAGIDYLIGVEALTGRGLGPQMIWSYLTDVVFAACPDVPRVIASPEVANRRSVRMLEKAGFRPDREIAGNEPGRPELLCVLDRKRVFGWPVHNQQFWLRE